MTKILYGESGYERIQRDAYFTPAWAIEALLDDLPLPGPVWEPANGEGAISDAVAARGYRVHRSDIHDYGNGAMVGDFLTMTEAPAEVRCIITNPPYGPQGRLARSFIENSLSLMMGRGGLVAMLLRADFDHGVTRRHIFSDCPFFSAKLALTARPEWFVDGDKGPRQNFAWFVWDAEHRGAPAIRWLHRAKPAKGMLAA